MHRGKYERKPENKFGLSGKTAVKALIVLLLAVILLVGPVGNTLAWMLGVTAPVTNTFTYGKIKIDLKEDSGSNGGTTGGNKKYFEMTPGAALTKDPTITVKHDSEECFLFVRMRQSGNFNDYLSYNMADGWSALDSTNYPGVYYRTAAVPRSVNDQVFQVIHNNTVTVTATQKQLRDLEAAGAAHYPVLRITAYAVQTSFVGEDVQSSNPTAAAEEIFRLRAVEAWKLIGAGSGGISFMTMFPDYTEPEVTLPTGMIGEPFTEPTEETTVPETTVPETTVPETTVPETTVPETTVPETTVPETSVPETTVPETSVPETTVPETTVPETTVPETTVPETTVPETSVPETTVETTVETTSETTEVPTT